MWLKEDQNGEGQNDWKVIFSSELIKSGYMAFTNFGHMRITCKVCLAYCFYIDLITNSVTAEHKRSIPPG